MVCTSNKEGPNTIEAGKRGERENLRILYVKYISFNYTNKLRADTIKLET